MSRNAVPMWTIFLSAEAQVVACSRQDCPLTLCVQRSSSYLSSEAFSCSRKPAFPWRARETEWGPKSHRLWPASSPLSLEVWLLMKQNNSRLALLLFDDDSTDMVDAIQWSYLQRLGTELHRQQGQIPWKCLYLAVAARRWRVCAHFLQKNARATDSSPWTCFTSWKLFLCKSGKTKWKTCITTSLLLPCQNPVFYRLSCEQQIFITHGFKYPKLYFWHHFENLHQVFAKSAFLVSYLYIFPVFYMFLYHFKSCTPC